MNAPDPSDRVGVLAKVGGAEIGGLARSIIRARLKIYREMATFDEADVSGVKQS